MGRRAERVGRKIDAGCEQRRMSGRRRQCVQPGNKTATADRLRSVTRNGSNTISWPRTNR